MTTKLEMLNRVLDSAHSARIQASTQIMGLVVSDCVDQALAEVSSAANWIDTRVSTVASSWSTLKATVSTTVEVCRVNSVRTYVAATNNYAIAGYINKDDFETKVRAAFTGTTDVVDYWTFDVSSGIIRCNPYPSDAAGKLLVLFEYQKVIVQPASDGAAYTIPNRLLSLVELRASSLFCLKHLGEPDFYQVFNIEYQKLLKQLIDCEQSVEPYVVPRRQQTQQPQGGQQNAQ